MYKFAYFFSLFSFTSDYTTETRCRSPDQKTSEIENCDPVNYVVELFNTHLSKRVKRQNSTQQWIRVLCSLLLAIAC